ncbi:MAG: hypothetical protein A3D31_09995 [Candidatus Fluviicola riflensis]|nr:MAG: hypothetical protein CHH17_14410 [Candidatus Fluviicola riflensis]OGS77337.1 MAG: hypothetical protein A3D31_09995 [Candidatus Fluviicola riflensis]OGS82633.1 MAG: hypothetical protein A2724_00105 [Fluviicola sp. RIFCSPHIGHO2_01_FULL_43_53]OGS83916.1 MAG: hypothetical protein A3E30_11395 [Fluviicola sp. RIFCSPHIGHO2_12_FULL_43_24]
MEQQTTPPKKAPTTIGERLMNYSAISFYIGILMIIINFFLSDCGSGCYIIDKHQITKVSPKTLQTLDADHLKDLRDKYHSVYLNRKEHYEKSSGALSTIVNALGICCLISILALYYERRDNISIAGIELPFKSVFLILPVLMLYLWLSFGFTYFSALDSRQVCYVSAVKYERVVDQLDHLKHKNDTKTKHEELQLNHDYSMVHNLEDMGIVDGSVHVFNGLYSDNVYAIFYEGEEQGYLTNKDEDEPRVKLRIDEYDTLYFVVGTSLYLIFGTLLGISVGFIISLLIHFQHLKTTNTLYAKCLVFTVFVLLCLSFTGFIMAKPYFMPFLGYIWLIAAVVIYVYVVRLRDKPELEG